jgi:anti-sigma factor RsiW
MSADAMDLEMKRACIRAAARMVFGLSIVAALIGIRMITATPSSMADAKAQLEALDAELAEEVASDPTTADVEVPGPDGASVLSRMGRAVPDPLSGAEASAPDPLVSCRLSGRAQFMRASDCAMRGGRSTLVELDSGDRR